MAKCPGNSCGAAYIGETARRISTRIEEHGGKDERSHIVRHMKDSGHHQLKHNSNFSILKNNSRGSNFIRKIKEALLIKKYKPNLNIQLASVPLKLF